MAAQYWGSAHDHCMEIRRDTTSHAAARIWYAHARRPHTRTCQPTLNADGTARGERARERTEWGAGYRMCVPSHIFEDRTRSFTDGLISSWRPYLV